MQQKRSWMERVWQCKSTSTSLYICKRIMLSSLAGWHPSHIWKFTQEREGWWRIRTTKKSLSDTMRCDVTETVRDRQQYAKESPIWIKKRAESATSSQSQLHLMKSINVWLRLLCAVKSHVKRPFVPLSRAETPKAPAEYKNGLHFFAVMLCNMETPDGGRRLDLSGIYELTRRKGKRNGLKLFA